MGHKPSKLPTQSPNCRLAMPRRTKPEETAELQRQLFAQLQAEGVELIAGETIVTDGPGMQDVAGAYLARKAPEEGKGSDSQRRLIGNWLAKRPYVRTIGGRNLTCVNSAAYDLQTNYRAAVGSSASERGHKGASVRWKG